MENQTRKKGNQIIDNERLVEEIFNNLNWNKNILSTHNLKTCITFLLEKNYKLKQFIACGGCGCVFKGVNTDSKQEVAIKISQNKDGILEEYLKEKKILENIYCNQFIIKIYDQYTIENDQIAIQIMELCEKDLKTQILERKSNNQYTKEEIAMIFFQLLNALVEIHINQIIHFDIKPQNILINSNNKYKLTDFGISLLLNDSQQFCEESPGHTKKYASPEQLNNLNKLDNKSDIFSMGLVFLEILGESLSIKQVEDIRDGAWPQFNVKQELKSYYSFVRYYMCQKDPLQRLTAQQLLSILFQFTFIVKEPTSELQRIDQILKQFEQMGIVNKYRIFLILQKAQLFQSNKYEIEKQINILEDLKLQLKESNKEYQEMKAEIDYQIAQGYYYNQDYQQYQNYLMKSLQIRQKINPNEQNLKIATLLNEIAGSYELQRNFIISNDYFLQAQKLYEKFQDEIDPSRLQFRCNLANSYSYIGDKEFSLYIHLEVLKNRKQILSYGHPDLITSLIFVSQNYLQLGQIDKAFDYCQEAFEMEIKTYDYQETKQLAQIYSLQSRIYYQLGDSKKALQFSYKSLQIHKLLFKDQYPLIIEILNLVGLCFANCNSFQNAIRSCEESLKILSNFKQEESSYYAETCNCLGDIYLKKMEKSKCIHYFEESLKIYENLQKIQGENNSKVVADQFYFIGKAYSIFGEYEKAEEQFNNSLKLIEKSDSHFSKVKLYINLGFSYYFLQKSEEAMQLFQKCLKILEEKGDQVDKIEILNGIGLVHLQLDQIEESLQNHQLALEMCERLFKQNKISLALCYQYIARVKLQQKEYVTVIKLCNSVISLRDGSQKNNFSQIEVYDMLGNSQDSIKDHQNSLQSFKESYKLVKQIYPDDKTKIANQLKQVCIQLQKTQEYKESIVQIEELIQIYTFNQPNNYQNLALSYYSLAETYQQLQDYTNSLQFSLKSLEIYDQIDSINQNQQYLQWIYQCIGINYIKLNNKEEALKYNLQAFEINKQLKNQESDQPLYYECLSQSYLMNLDYKKAILYQLQAQEVSQDLNTQDNLTNNEYQLVIAQLYFLNDDYEISFQNLIEYLIKNKSQQNINLERIATLISQFEQLLLFSQNERAIEYNQTILNVLEQEYPHLQLQIIQILTTLSSKYLQEQNQDQSLQLRMKALELSKLQDSLLQFILLFNASNCIHQMKDYQKSIQFSQNALTTLKNVQKIQNVSPIYFILCYYQMGNSQMLVGDHTSAVKSYQLGYKNIQDNNLFSNNEKLVIQLLENLTFCSQKINDLQTILESQLQLLNIKQMIFKEDNLQIAETLQNIAMMYLKMDNKPLSLQNIMRCIQIRKKLLSKNDILILESLMKLILNYQLVDDHKNVLKVSLESYAICLSNFKGDHQYTAQILSDIGNAYSQLGDKKLAEDYLLKSLKMRENLYKDNHNEILESYIFLNEFYFNQGDLNLALEYQLKMLKVREFLFQNQKIQDCQAIANDLQKISELYFKIQKLDESIQYTHQFLKQLQFIYPQNNNRLVADAFMSLGVLYHFKSDFNNALNYLKQSKQIYENLNEQKCFSYVKCLFNTVKIHTISKNYREAADLLIRALEISEKEFPHEINFIYNILNLLVFNLQQINQNVQRYLPKLKYYQHLKQN